MLKHVRNSGFGIHNRTTVYPSDKEGLPKLACYFLRSPVNLSRLRYHQDSQLSLYEPQQGQEVDDDALLDPLEFLARVLTHILRWDTLRSSPATSHSFEAARVRTIPEPHMHQVHFYGAYANRVRASYQREDKTPSGEANDASTPRRALSNCWAELIYLIYEVDPLTCLNCGVKMKILAFIIEPQVIRRILDHLDSGGRHRAPPSSTPSH